MQEAPALSVAWEGNNSTERTGVENQPQAGQEGQQAGAKPNKAREKTLSSGRCREKNFLTFVWHPTWRRTLNSTLHQTWSSPCSKIGLAPSEHVQKWISACSVLELAYVPMVKASAAHTTSKLIHCFESETNEGTCSDLTPPGWSNPAASHGEVGNTVNSTYPQTHMLNASHACKLDSKIQNMCACSQHGAAHVPRFGQLPLSMSQKWISACCVLGLAYVPIRVSASETQPTSK